MKTSILFTYRDGTFSDLIMWATGDEFSHVAVRYGDFVIHSNGHGLHIESYYHFCKKNYVYDEIEVAGDANTLFGLLAEHEGSMYDWGAVAFLGLSLVARKYLRVPMPKANLWQTTGMFLCSGWVFKYLNKIENDMATPGDIHRLLTQQ